MCMARAHPESISPTAHYTGYVWYRAGQSHDAFATRTGEVLYRVLHGPNLAAGAVGLPTMEGMLLARHRLIDLRLKRAIDAGEISQIVEVACGLSPRGWRFRSAYGDRVTYVEADLPAMLANKRRVLSRLGGETEHHYTREIDALAESGSTSIAALCGALDPARGTAIITEGLINYFDRETVQGMWRRFATALARFPRGLYLSDLIMRAGNTGPLATTFSWLLAAFVRGKTHVHFDSVDEAEAALAACGLDGELLDPRDYRDALPGLELAGAGRVRIIEATPR